MSRPPFADDQLSETNDGRVAVELKRPRANGATHAFMEPVAFLRRLTSLIPPAGMNLTRYFGILAPASMHRSKVVPQPEVKLENSVSSTELVQPPRRDGLDWASLLRRVYDVDALSCPCGGRLRIIAMIESPAVIRRILTHLGLPTEPPVVSPARGPPVADGWSPANRLPACLCYARAVPPAPLGSGAPGEAEPAASARVNPPSIAAPETAPDGDQATMDRYTGGRIATDPLMAPIRSSRCKPSCNGGWHPSSLLASSPLSVGLGGR